MIYKRITEYIVCALPPEHHEFHNFSIKVCWRGETGWAVVRWHSNLDANGEWDYEPSPSNREEEWVAAHRFTMERAMELAVEAAPLVEVNGYTIDDVKDWKGP